MRRFELTALCVLMVTPVLGGCAERVENPPASGDSSSKATEDATRELRIGPQIEPIGASPDGQELEQYLLSNASGMRVTIINWGATLTSVVVPDRDGNFNNVTLAFPTPEGYFAGGPYFGAICGRYANRIAGGRFTLDGQEYQLAKNNGPNHLHGGIRGFDKAVWRGEVFEADGGSGVKLTYLSRDGEEGYPGNLTVTVTYTLSDKNELRIDYVAQTDKPTPINLTNHAYWNLGGAEHPTQDILGHELQLWAGRYLPVDETLIPTGELADVKGTPMDFTVPTAIGKRISEVGDGYDHCYVIDDWAGDGETLRMAARVRDPRSGRVLEVFTTEPGVQLYTGNFLDGTEASGGYAKHHGFCLECQHFPDSPNQAKFPNTILRPGELYTQTTIYRFSVDQ